MQAFEFLQDHGLLPRSLIHVGANEGQEREIYKAAGVEQAVYVEPIPSVYATLTHNLSSFPGHRAVQALCSDVAGRQFDFNVASNGGQSSSYLGLGAHADLYPSIHYTETVPVVSTTVDALVAELFPARPPELLILDTQGTELDVLKGARKTLQHVGAIYTEVGEKPIYEGGCTFNDISEFLLEYGFRPKFLYIYRAGWGDALYISDDAHRRAWPIISVEGTNVALNKPARQSSLSEFSRKNEAGNAVNGNITRGFSFHTSHELDPWWEVDLEEPAAATAIVIYNRLDHSPERAYSLKAFVERPDGGMEQVHAQAGRPFGGRDGHPLIIHLDGRPIRRVRLQLEGHQYFHLNQVEIYVPSQPGTEANRVR